MLFADMIRQQINGVMMLRQQALVELALVLLYSITICML